MEKKNTVKKEEIKKKSKWFCEIDKDDLKNQVDNYNTLKFSHSWRGVAVMLISASIIIPLFLSLFGIYTNLTDMLCLALIFSPIIFFVNSGHRWAMILLMIMWTLDRGYALYASGNILIIIWWFVFITYFWKALKVENERMKLSKINIVSNIENKANQGGINNFCKFCGQKVDNESIFCPKCGNKLANK